MIISNIILENIYAYEDINEFNFNTDDKNIILIKGENGFGKTSFINSLKIGFHGITKDILKIGNKYIPKQEYIKGNENFEGLITKNKDFAKIEIETNEFKIIRTFPQDELVLIKDDEKYFGNEAQEIINQFFPENLNKFFFFDGEKVQEIANFENEEFKEMLENVLKLDIYDQSIKDLETLYKKIIKESLDKKSLQTLQEKEKLQNELVSKIETLEEKYEKLKENLINLQSQEKAMIKKSSKTKKLEKKLNEKKEEFNLLLTEFKKIILYKLPLLLNPTLLEKMKQDINNYDDLGIDIEVLLNKKKEFLSKIDDPKIEKIFDEVFLKEKKGFINSNKVKSLLNFEDTNFKDLLTNLSNLKYEIENINEELKNSDKSLFEDMIDLQKEILSLQNKIKEIEEKIFSNKENLLNLEKEIKKLEKIEFKNKLINKKLHTIENSINALKEIKISLKSKKRPVLENLINEKFKRLKKENFNIKKIKLTDEFNIFLINEENEKKSVLSASSGQKQIIAMSLIWGVSEYLNKEIPIIIDTPLGRLDTINQSLMLKEFYPNVSKQVIMLPTPSELRADEFKLLQNHISDSYCLSPKSPKVKRCEPLNS